MQLNYLFWGFFLTISQICNFAEKPKAKNITTATASFAQKTKKKKNQTNQNPKTFHIPYAYGITAVSPNRQQRERSHHSVAYFASPCRGHRRPPPRQPSTPRGAPAGPPAAGTAPPIRRPALPPPGGGRNRTAPRSAAPRGGGSPRLASPAAAATRERRRWHRSLPL